VFNWTWNDGFDPPHHHDSGLILTEFQGVCGLALRAQQVKFVELTAIDMSTIRIREKLQLCRKFWLLPWQLRKTANIRAILSVPMYVEKKSAESKHFVAVGVINVDAVTDEAAAMLKAKAQELSEYFTDEGKVIALLG